MELTKTGIYSSDFERFEAESAGTAPSWVAPLRKAAISRFNEVGFPTRHDEEWRFTNIAPLQNTPFRLAAAPAQPVDLQALAPKTFGALRGNRLVFVNGRYSAELSSVERVPQNVFAGSLAAALQSDPQLVEPHLARHAAVDASPFTALNTAFLQDGAFIRVPRGAVVEEPIHLVFVSTASAEPAVSHPRTLIVAGENSQVTVVETYVGLGEGVYWTNAVTEVVADVSAVVDHYKINRELDSAYHIATMNVDLAGTSNVSSHSITLGGAIVRNDANARMGGEYAECTLNGLYLATGEQIVDNHTAIDHAMPNCPSHEVYKGVLDDKARGVFNGKIFVRKDAQKTDAKQTNMTLLLSDDAQINTKPQLEIFADDVRCTHGATVGQINEEQMFYLRSRGIGEEEARHLLVYAFAADITERIKVQSVREDLSSALFERLAS